MSRCFPFPPPGYEREHRPQDSVLFKEAKHKEHKEKKEKKEKKDKNRKKDKEKKEKDGSERKKDKKDRKEKHKDKKEKHKDKKRDKEDRIKDKDKSSLSEESTIATKFEERSGEKLHPEGPNKHSSFEGEGKCSTLLQGLQGQNGKKPLFGTPHWNPSQVSAEAKNSDLDKSLHFKKLDLQCNGEFTGKAAVQHHTQVANSVNEGIPKPLKEQNDLRLEDIEKHKERLGSMHGEKQKDRDKKSHGKDKHKKKEKKEKKREEKANPKIENEISEPKNFGGNDLVSATFHGSVNFQKDVVGTAIVEESTNKRKDHPESNGFLIESEIRPNKVQKLALHHSTQNGKKLEAPSKYSSAVPNNIRPDLNNGTKEAKKPSPSKPNHTSGIEKFTDQISLPPKTPHIDLSNVNVALKVPKPKDHASEASRRPPHPDCKYLNQILTVPTVGEWSENDDQEWLFGNKGPSKKLELVEPNEGVQVWSEAVHIESADVCALPYVIPY